MNYLGIDYGEKKIGLAKSSSELTIATPFKILINDKDVLALLAGIVSQEAIDAMVVGYPLTLSGEKGNQATAVDAFIGSLSSLGKPVHRQDERFSTRSSVSAGEDHASAAALILQMYLDRHHVKNQ